ncbi:MAG: hypothetical protein WCA99_00570, partial [Candidatus Sulfotelmatobacter sp.]
MSATLQAPAPPQSAEVSEPALLVGLGLTSFASLLLELGLTRLFSVILFYHFAFLAISIALLGLGAGGVFAYLLKSRLARLPTRNLAAGLCMVNSVAVFLVLETVLHVPVRFDVDGINFLRLTVIYLFAATPFFLTGILFSAVFARETGRIPLLYGADLAGGALACMAVVPLLNWIGGPNTILMASVALAVAAAAWAPTQTVRRIAGGILAAFLMLIAGNLSD